MRSDDFEYWTRQVRSIPADSLNGQVVECDGRKLHLLHNYPAEYVDSTGRRRKVRNALDRLCGLEGVGFELARQWLIEHHDRLAADAAVVPAAPVPVAGLSAIDRRILLNLQAVYEALDCIPLDIWALNPNDPRKKDGFQLGKVYSFNDIKNDFKLYKAKNCAGYSIYAIPSSDAEDAIIVLDDIENLDDKKIEKRHSKSDAEKYIKKSFPNVYLRTSPSKTQALYIMKNYSPIRDYEVFKKVVQKENEKYGDKGLNSLRHFFRLPGFKNTKKKHEKFNYFVQLISTRRGQSAYMAARAADIRAAMAAGVVRHRGPLLPESDALEAVRRAALDAATETATEQAAAPPASCL